ncbi:MauE/DoxX family redox-associated membrane protein [Microbacterium aureliae]
MSEPFVFVLPLVLAGVLIGGALTKLRAPDDETGWAELGVPAPLRRPWLIRAHPWGELALAGALAALGGILGAFAAIAATLLMAAYLWLVVAAFRRRDETTCACFGTRSRVTRVTIVRNAWLTLLAIASVAVAAQAPPLGGAVAALGGVWIAALSVVAVTVALVLWPSRAAAQPGPAALPSIDSDELDYVRVRTPAVPVTQADGTVVNLRALAARRPILLLAVSETCSSCAPVIAKVEEWRSVVPEVEVRCLIQAAPEHTALRSTTEPQTLHDPSGYVRGSISDWSTPAAILLGSDGLLAGGPELGYTAISRFVADIRAALDEQLAELGATDAETMRSAPTPAE